MMYSPLIVPEEFKRIANAHIIIFALQTQRNRSLKQGIPAFSTQNFNHLLTLLQPGLNRLGFIAKAVARVLPPSCCSCHQKISGSKRLRDYA